MTGSSGPLTGLTAIKFGQYTREVLQQPGYTPAEIKGLIRSQSVITP